MNRKSLLVALFILENVLVIAGTVSMVLYRERYLANGLFIASFMVVLVLTLAILSEVLRSRRIERLEKVMWVAGLIFFHWIAAMVYLIAGRKRI